MHDSFWLKSLACPACGRDLDELSCCDGCGEAFPCEDGVPRLVAARARCEVRFEYGSSRDEEGAEGLLTRVLSEPSRYPGRGLPYHLDPAHAQRIAGCPAGGRILEIGCGGGQNRRWIREQGLQYVGTDVSRTRVFRWLQEYGGPDLLCDAHFLPFKDEQFDVVYSAAVTEHLACPQRIAQEVFRVLKPGGYFLSNVSFLEPWHDQSYFHMTPLGVTELLSRAGFVIEHIWPGRGYSGFQAVPAMVFRGALKLFRHLGRACHAVYRLQHRLKNLRRRFRGEALESAAQRDAVVAGAIDWIARRPTNPCPLSQEQEV